MPLFDLPLEQLREYRPERSEPPDFDQFWKETLIAASASPLEPEFRPHDAGLSLVDVSDVRFSGWGGHRIAGWFLTPRGATGPLPTVVQYLGYHGGRGVPLDWLVFPTAGYACLVMDTRRRATELVDRPGYREIVDFLAHRRHLDETVFGTLDYFDGVNLAARATAPARYSVALMDPVCPPSTVFAAYNHYGGPAGIDVWKFNGHEGGGQAQRTIQLRWLAEVLAGHA